MTDQILLEGSELGGNAVTARMPHVVNGGGAEGATRQVIPVQINPGETLQCAERQGLGPMMSHNGFIPPIRVPPGYSSQVLKTVEQSPGEVVTHTPVF